jgi:hypothetical protein
MFNISGNNSTEKILKRYRIEEILNTVKYLTYCLGFDVYSEEDKKAIRETIVNLSKNIKE